MTRLHLDGLTREFGATTAVDDVSVDVADGEFFTLVGPSGCGKTTTLRLIAGFEEPDAGDVRFGSDGASDGESDGESDGQSMTGVPPEQRDVGIVFQSYALFPHMTVGENVAYGLRFRDPPGGVSKRERVSELLELVDLPDMQDRDPDELSGGQQQRVALARALAPGPSVLLLDEPMSALDARLRERLRGQVKEIQRELEITTVYVTHDQEEALSISDRVAVMNDGRVEQVGTPEEVYREPASRFVAEFVGDNNVFHGEATPLQAGSDQQPEPGERAALDRDQSESPLETGGSSVVVGSGTFVVADSVSGDVTVSVRPESLSFDSGVNQLAVEVERVEFLGDTYKVHCDWNGTPLLVKAGDAPEPGAATVSFAPEDADVVARE